MALTCKQTLEGLNVGDYVWCSYYIGYSQDYIGSFSDIATKNDGQIPRQIDSYNSQYTYLGYAENYFKFICVDIDQNTGKRILVADRNIQRAISQDSILHFGIDGSTNLESIGNITNGWNYNAINSNRTGYLGDEIYSSVYSTYYAWKAFNNSYGSAGQCWAANATTGYIGVNFSTPTAIIGYQVAAYYGGPSLCPKNWSAIAGSYTIHNVSNETGWANNQVRTYYPSIIRKGSNFYLNVTAINGTTRLAIGDLYACALVPSGWSLNTTGYSGKLRQLTTSEWTSYIVNSNLNGTITAGDNNIWNWNNPYPSWVQGSTVRGGTGGVSASSGLSSSSTSGCGFRPVLELTIPSINKYLIQDGTSTIYTLPSVSNTKIVDLGLMEQSTFPANIQAKYRITIENGQHYCYDSDNANDSTSFTVLDSNGFTYQYTSRRVLDYENWTWVALGGGSSGYCPYYPIYSNYNSGNYGPIPDATLSNTKPTGYQQPTSITKSRLNNYGFTDFTNLNGTNVTSLTSPKLIGYTVQQNKTIGMTAVPTEKLILEQKDIIFDGVEGIDSIVLSTTESINRTTSAKSVTANGNAKIRTIGIGKTINANGNARIRTSGVGKIGTTVGSAQISTSQYKYGNSSGLFDGSSDYITFVDSNDWHLSGDFTIQGHFRFNSIPGSNLDRKICGQIQDGTNHWQFYLTGAGNNNVYLRFQNYQSSMIIDAWSDVFTVSTSAWYHFRIIRVGNTIRFFVNGTQSGGDFTNANRPNNYSTIFFVADSGSSIGWNGYIDDFEVANGIARDNGQAFTTPSSLVADQYTKLLLKFDGNNGSTTFNDSSEEVSLVAPFGTGMGYFDGTGDYLSIANSSSWNFGTNSFVITFRTMFNALPASGQYMGIFSQYTDGNNYHGIFLQNASGILRIRWNWQQNTGASIPEINITRDISLSTGVWYHWAFVRSGNDFRIFIDGVQQGTVVTNSNSLTSLSSQIEVGRFSTQLQFNGYMKEFYVVNGTDLGYTSDFTLPTTYTAGQYSVLLLHMDGTQDSTTFIDNSADYIVPSSGSAMGYFDGTNSYLSVTPITSFAFMHKTNAQWTISTRMRLVDFGSTYCIFDTANSTSSNSGITCNIGTDRKINFQMYFGSSGNYIIPNDAVAGEYPNDTGWHDIEISCDLTLANGNLKVYVDNVLVRTTNKTANTPSTSNNAYCSIGMYGNAGGQALKGYMDIFSISNTTRNIFPITPSSLCVPDNNTILLLNYEGTQNSTTFVDTTIMTGASNIKIIVSNDSGITWKTYSGGSWNSINPTINDVASGGMSVATFNALSPAALDSLLVDSDLFHLRFGFYIDINTINDTQTLDSLGVQLDINGHWRITNHIEAKYSIMNKKISVHLYDSGNYIVNY